MEGERPPRSRGQRAGFELKPARPRGAAVIKSARRGRHNTAGKRGPPRPIFPIFRAARDRLRGRRAPLFIRRGSRIIIHYIFHPAPE